MLRLARDRCCEGGEPTVGDTVRLATRLQRGAGGLEGLVVVVNHAKRAGVLMRRGKKRSEAVAQGCQGWGRYRLLGGGSGLGLRLGGEKNKKIKLSASPFLGAGRGRDKKIFKCRPQKKISGN